MSGQRTIWMIPDRRLPCGNSAAAGMVMTPLGGFTPGAFRIAWLAQYPVWLAVVAGVPVMRRRARGLDGARGLVPRPVRDALARSYG
jgi:hypothetical protein